MPLEESAEQGRAAVSAGRFREVFGHLPTGVTVITAFGPDGPIGMAANSVTSVSLDPPLLLFCPAKSSTTWPGLRAAKRFCVNIMAGHHAHLARQFAASSVDRYAGVDFEPGATGPVLDGALAWLHCDLYEEHDAGDHTIAVARVTELDTAAGHEPLVFFRGAYGTFQQHQPS